ncbi:MAG: RMD1 family protein [Deltaproteobacteria bacterium]|nr:RMD1 family protein [Deltaproteobacteria bacterium]
MCPPEVVLPDKQIFPVESAPPVRPHAKPAPAPVREMETYPFNALHLTEALKLKDIAKLFDLKPQVLNPNRLVYELAPDCFTIFYNFGSVVFFNVDEVVQRTTLERIRNFSPGIGEPATRDTFILEVARKARNTVTFDKVVVDRLNRDKIELISLVLSQSTALEFFENKIENILTRLAVITSDLESAGKTTLSEKKINQFIGQAMAAKQKLIGTLYLLEKPDETWESKVLDDLHQEATMMFELKDRFRTIDYKLKTIQENLELLANLTTNRQHLRLEWIIIALIVMEVALFGYELFLK